jgi:hypothetical protein
LSIAIGDASCGWPGCSGGAEATLNGRSLCRGHFYDMAARNLEEHRARLERIGPLGADRIATLKFLSELINQTTTLVARAKFLGPSQRAQFLELSLSAAELYKRVQRNPRIPHNTPILIYREADSTENQELTNTVNVSKQGACIATIRLWETGEKIWIQKPGSQLRTRARVAWAKKNGLSQFHIGLEILECADYWELEPASPKRRS